MEIFLIALLTFVASGVGTLTGFGTSTIMMPVMASFFTLPETLLFVGIIHWFGNVWKMTLFREGLRWDLILKFGIPGVAATILGGWLMFGVNEDLMSRILGGVLLGYVAFLFVKDRFRVPENTTTAVAGGTLYGFSAGIFGIGGAIRGAFLAAFDLRKAVYIATAGAIGLAIDTGRIGTYLWEGAEIPSRLLWGMLLFIPLSFAGAKAAEQIVERIPQGRFRMVIAVFLGLAGLRLLIFP